MIDYQLTIPGVELKSSNHDLRGTTIGGRMAAAARAREQRTGVATMCRAKFGTSPRGANNQPIPLKITITRIGPRELDSDNNVSSAKHVRDGIADWLGINDRSKSLKWEYAQAKGEPKEYGVKIRVETWRRSFAEVLACSKEYQQAHKKLLKASEARDRIEMRLMQEWEAAQ